MAHFTGLKELQNHPHKAGFDIGSKNVFTAKVGKDRRTATLRRD
jgi:hypothetical protein